LNPVVGVGADNFQRPAAKRDGEKESGFKEFDHGIRFNLLGPSPDDAAQERISYFAKKDSL
jgi:hypothetical protein